MRTSAPGVMRERKRIPKFVNTRRSQNKIALPACPPELSSKSVSNSPNRISGSMNSPPMDRDGVGKVKANKYE
jgi:hypothetical protein